MHQKHTNPQPQIVTSKQDIDLLKQEVYRVYQENLHLRQLLMQLENKHQFYSQCQLEITRLKKLLKQASQQKQHIPSERQEIKDRIIMKLEDELISTQIELRQAKMQLSRNYHR